MDGRGWESGFTFDGFGHGRGWGWGWGCFWGEGSGGLLSHLLMFNTTGLWMFKNDYKIREESPFQPLLSRSLDFFHDILSYLMKFWKNSPFFLKESTAAGKLSYLVWQ